MRCPGSFCHPTKLTGGRLGVGKLRASPRGRASYTFHQRDDNQERNKDHPPLPARQCGAQRWVSLGSLRTGSFTGVGRTLLMRRVATMVDLITSSRGRIALPLD
ncbi:MAG TPA: hypothetical protein VGM75_32665 [Pseudonocardiaceae bacterium]